MLAKLVDSIPTTDGLLFEPKWDGFRAIVFRSQNDVYIQSRDLKPLDRYFPELHAALLARLRRRWRDRDRAGRCVELRRAAAAAASGGVAGREAVEGHALVVRRL